MNGQKTGLHKTYYNNGDLKNEVKHLFKFDPIDDECPLPLLKKKIIIE